MIYVQRIFATGNNQYVYYSLPVITTTPLTGQTSPNWTGSLVASSHAVITKIGEGAISVLDDGVLLTPNASSIDFTGDTAAVVGDAVTVTVTGEDPVLGGDNIDGNLAVFDNNTGKIIKDIYIRTSTDSSTGNTSIDLLNTNEGVGSTFSIFGGGSSDSSGGNLHLRGGFGGGGPGGGITLETGGNEAANADGPSISLVAGASSGEGVGGDISATAGNSTTDTGGSIPLKPGSGINLNSDGSVIIERNNLARASKLSFVADSGTKINIKAPTFTADSNYTMVLPTAQGAASTVLTNDGNGNLSWSPGGGGSSINGPGSPTNDRAIVVWNGTGGEDVANSNVILFEDEGVSTITTSDTPVHYNLSIKPGITTGNDRGGDMFVSGGWSALTYDGGDLVLLGGFGDTDGSEVEGGKITIPGGHPIGNAPDLLIRGASGESTNANGGNIRLLPGIADGTGTPGTVMVAGTIKATSGDLLVGGFATSTAAVGASVVHKVATPISATGSTLVNGSLQEIGVLVSTDIVNLPNPNVSAGQFIDFFTPAASVFRLKSPAGNINGTAGTTGIVITSSNFEQFTAKCNGTNWYV
jgi:hypothetical protein